MLFPPDHVPVPHTSFHFHFDFLLRLYLRLYLRLRPRLHFRAVRRPGPSGVLLVPAPRPLLLQRALRVLEFFMQHLLSVPRRPHHR